MLNSVSLPATVGPSLFRNSVSDTRGAVKVDVSLPTARDILSRSSWYATLFDVIFLDCDTGEAREVGLWT